MALRIGRGELKKTMIMDGEELSLFNEPNDTRTIFLEPLALNRIIFSNVLYVIAFVIGMLGNIITCILIGRNRSMHSKSNMYFSSLCISNIMILIFGFPVELNHLWKNYMNPFGDTASIIMEGLYATAANTIGLTLTVVTFDIYNYVMQYPKTHIMPKLPRFGLKKISAIWVCALCSAVLQEQVIQFGIVTDEKKEYGAQQVFGQASFIFFIGHMTLMTVMYLFIIIKLHTSKESSIDRREGSIRILRFKSGASQRRVIRMLFAVVLSYFLLLLPYHVQRLLSVNGKDMKQATDDAFDADYAILKSLSGGMYLFFAALNPIHFYIFSDKLRNAFKVTITSWCRCQNRLQLERTYSDVMESEKIVQRPRHPRQQQLLRADFCPVHGVPAQAQLKSLNQNSFTESSLWRQELAAGTDAMISPQTISNSSLRDLEDKEQNRHNLANYLMSCEIIEERVTTV